MTISELCPHGSAQARPDVDSANTPAAPYLEPANVVYRFGVHLRGTDPPIWRLIDVPAEYRFWDLHVAIQDAATYVYDFGDGWQHEVALSRVLPREPGVRYPVCRDGERACPPEDCGGVGGFRRFLDILADPNHKEHEAMATWLIDHVGPYHPYDPEEFDPAEVAFDDPQERWVRANTPLRKSQSHC